jgi:peptidoglycan hydrolase-like protein with peptidoglycan-binding domain
MANEPELRRGSDGEWVSYLQGLLQDAGHSPGAIDGDFGPRTEAAVRAYQEANGLGADGIVGPPTWASLTAGASSEADAGAGAGAGGGGDQASADVPQELVSIGFPASFAEWTDEHKNAYFGGEPQEQIQTDGLEEVEVLAMQGSEGEGEALA